MMQETAFEWLRWFQIECVISFPYKLLLHPIECVRIQINVYMFVRMCVWVCEFGWHLQLIAFDKHDRVKVCAIGTASDDLYLDLFVTVSNVNSESTLNCCPKCLLFINIAEPRPYHRLT